MRPGAGMSLALALALAGPAAAAEDAALLLEGCVACHGALGASVADHIPNLAGQRQAYLEAQLRAFRDARREDDFMVPIARQLDDRAIALLAEYFSELPAVEAGARGALLSTQGPLAIDLPKDYRKTYTHYATLEFPDRPQIRRYFADPATVAAVGEGRELPPGASLLMEIYEVNKDASGRPLSRADGQLEPGGPPTVSIMQRGAGWGEALPVLLRNGDWQYAVFTPDGRLADGVNYAACFACHRAAERRQFVFTLPKLAEKLRQAR